MSDENIIQCRQLVAGNLAFDYHGEPLDLEVNQGEIIGIIGTNDSGRSHWLKTISGLEDQRSGSLQIHGVDTLNLSADEWSMTRMKIAYLHADTALMSAANGLMNVLAPAIYHRLDRKFKNGLLASRALALLQEIDPALDLDNLPAYIPKEQQFKIATARALLLEPDVLVLDNPFTHFGNESKLQFQSFLAAQVIKGLSLLIVTNDIPYVLDNADRIIFAERDNLHVFTTREALLDCDIPTINEYIRLNT